MRTKAQLLNLVKKTTQKKRGAKTEIYLTIDGEVKSLREWAEFFELDYYTVLYRYHAGKRGRDLIKPPRKKTNFYI